MEKLLLDMTACGCTDGIFYCLALQHSNQTVVRYFESGCFSGIMKDKYQHRMSSTAGIELANIFLMQLYTLEDIIQCTESLADRHRSIVRSRRAGKNQRCQCKLNMYVCIFSNSDFLAI
jgi:hypothetical protein